MRTNFQQSRSKQESISCILRGAKQFARTDRGSITFFSLFIFIAMLMMVGMTIDIMRHEAIRTRLQSTADRAVLAAADLDQQIYAKTVVLDYFEKAGLKDFVQPDDIIVDDTALNYKSVSAQVDYTMPTWFMNMSGIHSLSAGSYSKAEEKIQNIEVSLVLDISGSMGDPSATPNVTKIAAMQTAANEFVRLMMASNPIDLDPTEGITSVSVIPYHGAVNAGATLMGQLQRQNSHEYSHCMAFTEAQVRTPTINTNTAYPQQAHFDYRTGDYFAVDGFMTLKNPFCQPGSYGEILMHSVSLSDLTTKINSLQASGWTAIDLGLKWGAILIDPSSRSITNTLVTAQDLNAAVQDRPVDYTPDDPNQANSSANTVKVIVLMTDGDNTRQYDLEPWAKSGKSPVWYSAAEDTYSVHFEHRSGQKWWIPELDANNDVVVSPDNWADAKVGAGDAVQIDHQVLFSMGGLDFISDYFFRTTTTETYCHWYYGCWEEQNEKSSDRQLREKYRYADTYSGVGYGYADTNATTLCNTLKNENVVIYSIAFEAPQRGQDLMQACASKPGNYFDVNGQSISQAFKAIADNIQQLRLTF